MSPSSVTDDGHVPSSGPSTAAGLGLASGGPSGDGGAAIVHKRTFSNEEHSPAESNASSQPGRDAASSVVPEDQRTKKRRTGPGSRGVANLTPEQLAKKRANDREAQRAIRERTKNQIEGLEKRISDLTSQKPYQELQSVIRAKETVEAENADLRNRLATIMSVIQPVVANQQAEGAYASPLPTYLPAQAGPPPLSMPSAHNVSTPGSAASPGSQDPSWHNGGLQSGGSSSHTSPSFTQVKMISQQRQEQRQSLDLGSGEHLKLDFLLDPGTSQRVNRMQTGVNGAQDSPSFKHLPMKHDWNGTMSAVAAHRPGATSQQQTSQRQPQRLEYSSDASMAPGSEAAWSGYTGPMKNCMPTCPLDSILLDFLNERRQRAAEGVPTREIVGPRYPSVSSLLNPAKAQYSHPLSKVFTDILATFPGICTLPERVGVLYIMFLVMRYQIAPTQENASLLPEWVHPRPAQVYTSHPAWCDHLPWPDMREKIAQEYNPQEFLFENFFIPYTNTISLNWPYEGTDTLLQSPDGEELILNPVFERHLRRLENWTLGEEFHQTFPQLEGTYNLKMDGSARPGSSAADRRTAGGL